MCCTKNFIQTYKFIMLCSGTMFRLTNNCLVAEMVSSFSKAVSNGTEEVQDD